MRRTDEVTSDVPSELALEYFRIANGIVAFHVVQTILFLNAIYKATELQEALFRKPVLFHSFTWGFAVIYAAVIVGCGVLEVCLRGFSREPPPIITLTWIAVGGRVLVVLALATACSLVIALLKAPTAGA
jgi:hypothetical protein